MERACCNALLNPVDEADIRQLNEDYPHENPGFRNIENDMIAFIRNERQILYYYGFFHSKSTGATDFEFSSLTPIGELALKANANEFLVIWEHQKIKMISQPATADVNQVSTVTNSATSFGISYTPYTDILGHLLRYDTLTLDEYKYIISRKKHNIDEETWIQDEENIFRHLPDIKNLVNSFGRQRDSADEDGRKELLKYLLGIRNDLPVDSGLNPLGILKFRNAIVSVENTGVLTQIYSIYTKLDDYKIQRYITVFENSENDLKRRYIDSVAGQPSSINSNVKIFWDLYNIHPDTFIMVAVALTYAAVTLGVEGIENVNRESLDAVIDYLYGKFRGLFRNLGIRTFAAIKREIQKVLLAIKNEDYSNYLTTDEEQDEQILARYRAIDTADLLQRIQQISRTAIVTPAENRERNGTLVSLLKSYYLSRFAENQMLKCECCGEETFITSAGEPYIEFHHLIPFNIAYGPDHYLNLFALCPSCHRKIHFMRIVDKKNKYAELSDHNYFHICFTERLRELRKQNLLRSYHLEYLLADNAITLEEYNTIAA